MPAGFPHRAQVRFDLGGTAQHNSASVGAPSRILGSEADPLKFKFKRGPAGQLRPGLAGPRSVAQLKMFYVVLP